MARCASKRQTKDTERIQDWRFLPGRRGTRWLGPRKRDKLRAKLTNILLSADIRGVVSALVFQGPLPKRADYHVAIQYCMEGLVHQAFRYPVGERVTFVIDQKDKVKNEVEATRIWLQKDGHRSMGRRVGGAVFDDSRIILPLQAADLLAYEPLQEVKSYGIPGRGSPFVATVTMKTFGPRYMLSAPSMERATVPSVSFQDPSLVSNWLETYQSLPMTKDSRASIRARRVFEASLRAQLHRE